MNGHAVVDPFATLVAEVKRQVLLELAQERGRSETAGERPLLKVREAAAMLKVNRGSIYRLINNGELAGVPFPEANSYMHVDQSSLLKYIDRRLANEAATRRRGR